ncbi:MAG: alkaline phosphatase D family protein [candidate division KSB1 bacterium]|nr:alkaline phosphatase D family protein [candidate division KSB1 bacterium]MDZ7335858.1 alkaline phosphatase D family protein [candidate division KSB1 bacterium]MDZ7377157.1 alkaline phosphatase D family protein [candidate division KSB1 bacterium]
MTVSSCFVLHHDAAGIDRNDAVYFATGYKIGEVTSNSAVVWARLTASPERNWHGIVPNPHESPTRVMQDVPNIPVRLWEGSAAGADGEVRIIYSTSPDLKGAKMSAWRRVDPNADFTYQFKLDQLEPNMRYYLQLEGRTRANGPITKSAPGSFRTAPGPDDIQTIWFAVSSCQMYYHREHRDGFTIYPSMMRCFKSLPDFMVRIGDAVYYDRDNPRAKNVELCRLHWQRMYSLPFLKEFHYNVPCYWMKDDHDTFFDDCWRTYEAPWIEPLTFEDGERVFREQTPASPSGEWYRTVRWGKNLQIWLLEGRSYRSPNEMPDGPEKTIWGTEQKSWLKRTLLESNATFKVVLSPSAIVGPDNPDQEDNHSDDAFFHEGNEFRQWTKENHLDHLYIINGDRHWQYMSTDPKSGLREFSCGPSSDMHAVQGPGYNIKYHSFYRPKGGFISVTVSEGEQKVLARPQRIVFEASVPTINIRFHDVDGNILYEYRDTALPNR